jgi:putative ABC transport system permease protein
MKIFLEIVESTRIAFEQILGSKLRSFLSALGVVIGISVVIIMGWLIFALNDVVENTFQMMGVNMMWVSRWDWTGATDWEEVRNRKRFTYKLTQEFKERMQSAELVTISATNMALIKYGTETFEGITIEGRDNESQFTSGGEIVEGRFFSMNELNSGENVITIGSKVNEAIFPNGDAIGKTLKILGRHFKIVGIIKKQGTVMMDFVDNRVAIPLNTYFKLYGKNGGFEIGVKAAKAEDLDAVRIETEGIMRTLRNIKPGEENDFSINESKAFEESTKAIRASVYGVGIGMTMLSFIVGIIGIMNIMFVSVTERTKEIGIRKAIGAKNRSILMQFIIEAAALCFIGAIISFVVCSILIFAIATILPKYFPSASILSPYLPVNLLIIASLISIFVGIIAGLIPAVRASKLVPVDALKFE